MELVTGYKGSAHITSDDDAARAAALVGNDAYVLEHGSRFAYEISTNNLIILSGGNALFQGRHCRTKESEKENCVIENGTQGQMRADLICIKYTKTTDGKEGVSVVVLKGTPGAAATDPAYTSGDIENGAKEFYMPLYRVTLNGLNIQSVQQMFNVYHRIPNFSYGTADPSGGSDGDVYFKIIE